jgi:hypothetical protein
MADEERDDERRLGHNSTTIPGGERQAGSGDPGRTPGKAEGDDQTADESPARQEE